MQIHHSLKFFMNTPKEEMARGKHSRILGGTSCEGLPVAVKLSHHKSNSDRTRNINEAFLHKIFSGHPGFPHLCTCFFENRIAILVTERTTTDLAELIQKGNLSLEQKNSIIRQIVLALSKMHSTGYAHLNLDPSNILVNEDADGFHTVKLSDFGNALTMKRRLEDAKLEHIRCTPLEMLGPMYFKETSSLEKIDVFQLGCLIAHLLLGHPLFEWPNDEFSTENMGHEVKTQIQVQHVLLFTRPDTSKIERICTERGNIAFTRFVKRVKRRFDETMGPAIGEYKYVNGFNDLRVTSMGWTWSRVVRRLLDIDPEQRMTLGELLETPMLACGDPTDAVMSGMDEVDHECLMALL